MINNIINSFSNGTSSQAPHQEKSITMKNASQLISGEIENNRSAQDSESVALGMHLDLEALSNIQEGFKKTFSYSNTDILFSIDKETGKSVFKIIDKENGKILKQFPPEELLKFAQRLIEFLDGKIVNTKA